MTFDQPRVIDGQHGASTVEARWSDVEELGRCVDRQLECLRSMLAAADPALMAGPLAEVVRRSAADAAVLAAELEAAARDVTRRLTDEGGEATDGFGDAVHDGSPTSALVVCAAVARCLCSISALAAWSIVDDARPGRFDDVVQVLADDVTDRFRALLFAWSTRSRELVGTGSATRLPFQLYGDQLFSLVPSGFEEQPAVLAWRGAIAWMAIAGQVAEATAWLAAFHAFSAPEQSLSVDRYTQQEERACQGR